MFEWSLEMENDLQRATALLLCDWDPWVLVGVPRASIDEDHLMPIF